MVGALLELVHLYSINSPHRHDTPSIMSMRANNTTVTIPDTINQFKVRSPLEYYRKYNTQAPKHGLQYNISLTLYLNHSLVLCC